MIWPALKMMLALVMVLAVLFFLVRVFRRTRGIHGALLSDPGIKLLTSKLIAHQKYVSLVEIGGEVFALGISETQITLLTKIENKEFVERMKTRPSAESEPSWFHALPLRNRGAKGGPTGIFHER